MEIVNYPIRILVSTKLKLVLTKVIDLLKGQNCRHRTKHIDAKMKQCVSVLRQKGLSSLLSFPSYEPACTEAILPVLLLFIAGSFPIAF